MPRRRPLRNSTISLRLPADELAALDAAARCEGVARSEFLRSAITTAAAAALLKHAIVEAAGD